MITINIDGVGHTDPDNVEVYVGAMESYEHFDIGGIHWKLPTGMVVDLLVEIRKKASLRNEDGVGSI